VIVVSLTGYGQTGPSADYMAYGPAGGAIAGLYSVTGYEDGPAAETGIAVGDPTTGITAAWAVVASLVARRRTGAVARVDVAMVEAIATTVGEAWMAYVDTGAEPPRMGNHDPIWSPHNCYAVAGDDQWLTIACTDEAQWQGLCRVIDPALAGDARFADATARKANEAALDERIAAWATGRDPWEATWALQAEGVAAFPSLSPLPLWTGDPQLEAIGMLERPDHPAVGRQTVPGIPWRLTNGPNGLRRPAPMLAQHTEEVLTELLGYSVDEVVRLNETGALRQPDQPRGAAPART
jgi:crotonobetainyl-CoA:carnitine CoA-transferase CaiB-like acyl-CoA transferase